MTKIPLFVVLVATLCAFAYGPLATSAGAAAVPDGEARPDEPMRGEFSLDAAVAYLDQMTLTGRRLGPPVAGQLESPRRETG